MIDGNQPEAKLNSEFTAGAFGSAFLVFAALVPLAANAQPAAPAGLRATAGDEQAVLTWRDPSNDAIVRYEFRFGAGEAPEFNAWAEVPGSGEDTVEHTVSDLANGTRYGFEVRAVDDEGAGEAASASTMLAASPSSAVEVPDAGLRAAIERTLGLASGAPLTQGDLARLVDLRAGGEQVADLAGLGFATNLAVLDLGNNAISNLSALSDMTSLRRLLLWGNDVSDVSALSGLTSLTTLSLSANEVSDVSALSGLESLTELRLQHNALTEVSLSGMPSLRTLYLHNNELSEVSLSRMPSLAELWLSSNELSDVSALSGMPSLTTLFLGGNELSDVSGLSSMPSLTTLYLDGNRLSDVSALSGLTSLTDLHLDNNSISDVSALSGLTSLTALRLSNNQVSDVSALSGLTSLTHLRLSGNELSDVSVLSGLTLLTELYLDSNSISDVSALSGLTSLSSLVLWNNEVSDLSALADLRLLTTLYLDNNQVSDVSALSGLTSLTTLSLDGNAISDISSLGDLEQLSFLVLRRNAVSDMSPLLDSGLQTGNYADLRGNPLREGQADHVEALRESGTVVVFDDGGHRVPLFPSVVSAVSPAMGFVRVINHSDDAGSVSIEAVDETGERRGPESLAIEAGQVLHFNAQDLEQGNLAKGLRGVGEAVGDWRLVLRSELDIEVLGYARTPDGFVSSLHDMTPETWFSGTSRVPTFNPGSNRRQVSRLRLTNPTDRDRGARVQAWDDTGRNTRGSLSTPAGGTVELTAAQLESGDGISNVAGIGDRSGKWWLNVNAPGRRVMSLLQSPNGHLANISTGTAVPRWHRAFRSWQRGGRYRVPLFLAATNDIQGFLRIVNLSAASAAITLRAFDSSGAEREPAMLTLKSREVLHFNSWDLESGNAAKGLPGIGAATGDWHLEVSGNRRFEVLTYARTADGCVTSLHDIAPRLDDGSLWIPFFNPGSNRSQASRLRLVNWGETAAEVTITGTDDAGNSPGEAVRASVPAQSARDYMAWELETGSAAGLSGALGDGSGKWRLRVSAPGDVEAMSLLGLPTGHVTNLSTTPRHPRE